MTENLKRCPFCGGEAQIIRCNSGKYQCFCRNCGCAQTMFFDSPEEVPEEWNARPIENELTGKIEKLEAENARLREALEEIKNTVKEAQDPVYSFHFDLDSKHGAFILETAEKALKGDEE